MVVAADATAQTAAHEVKAREIYARVISFRTAAGQKQTAPMAAYLVAVLKAGSVPEVDIATLDQRGRACAHRAVAGTAARSAHPVLGAHGRCRCAP